MSTNRSAIQEELGQTRPFESIAQEATVAMIRTVDMMLRYLASVVEPYDITLQQYNVLRILRGAKVPIPTMEIAQRMIEQTPGVTRMIDRLEKKGLVERQRDSDDRRQVLCQITRPGVELLAKLDGPIFEADEKCMAPLDREDLEKLIDLLDTLRKGWS